MYMYRKRDFCGDTRLSFNHRVTKKTIVNFCSMRRASTICKRAKPIRASRRRIGVKVERVTLLSTPGNRVWTKFEYARGYSRNVIARVLEGTFEKSTCVVPIDRSKLTLVEVRIKFVTLGVLHPSLIHSTIHNCHSLFFSSSVYFPSLFFYPSKALLTASLDVKKKNEKRRDVWSVIKGFIFLLHPKMQHNSYSSTLSVATLSFFSSSSSSPSILCSRCNASLLSRNYVLHSSFPPLHSTLNSYIV